MPACSHPSLQSRAVIKRACIAFCTRSRLRCGSAHAGSASGRFFSCCGPSGCLGRTAAAVTRGLDWSVCEVAISMRGARLLWIRIMECRKPCGRAAELRSRIRDHSSRNRRGRLFDVNNVNQREHHSAGKTTQVNVELSRSCLRIRPSVSCGAPIATIRGHVIAVRTRQRMCMPLQRDCGDLRRAGLQDTHLSWRHAFMIKWIRGGSHWQPGPVAHAQQPTHTGSEIHKRGRQAQSGVLAQPALDAAAT